jgi:hypothetical protein
MVSHIHIHQQQTFVRCYVEIAQLHPSSSTIWNHVKKPILSSSLSSCNKAGLGYPCIRQNCGDKVSLTLVTIVAVELHQRSLLTTLLDLVIQSSRLPVPDMQCEII